MPRSAGFVVLSALLVSGPSPLGATTGTAVLQGRVVDDSGRPVGGARLRLVNRVSGFRQAVLSEGSGRYAFLNIPFNQYHLEAEAPGMQTFHANVELRSAVPQDLGVTLKSAGAVVEILDETRLVEDHATVHLDIDQSSIEKIPAAVQSRALESILLATPGFIADENGRFHFRGSHGQVTYVVDGIPISDQLHATFSNSLDPSQVASMEVITGGISAEFGGKPVAVVNLSTRSGLGTPRGFEGEVSLAASRFRTAEASLTLRGGSDQFGYFATAAGSKGDRFLDPVDFGNWHNHGETGRLYTRFDWILGAADTLRLSVSGGQARREVPNLASQQVRGQDQRAATTDQNLSLAWTRVLDASRTLEASAFFRRAGATLDPSENLEPGFDARPRRDLPVWARQDRTLENRGLQASCTVGWGGGSITKAGIQFLSYPLVEHFRFAVTDQAFAADPGDPLYPFTAAGGGAIWRFDGSLTPRLASAYLQNDLHLGDWFIAAGLRYDHYTVAEVTQALLQPRLGLSHALPWRTTVLRASYDRLLVARENENLALSLSQAAWDLGPFRGTPRQPLRPETQHAFSAGVEQQVGTVGRLSLEWWERRSRNAGDNEQFFNTGVLFPVAAERGLFRGANLRLDLTPVGGWSGYLSLGRTRALFQAPLAGGLQLEMPERLPGERFLVDHDQKLAAQLGIRWESRDSWVQVIGRHDSGLVAGDPSGAAGDPDHAFGVAFVRRDSEGTWRVKPRTLWDLEAGWTIHLGGGRKLLLVGDLLNALDHRGLYNFLSAFGGTHVIPPRNFSLRVKYRF
ncbi:MAG: TonB-dependent receptor [Acidobacteria bacterium]|nr:TonB-dependent receptor [Acidobacteriota bacterium]